MPLNPKANRLAWRLAIVVLLLAVTALAGSLAKNLKAPHPSELPNDRVRPRVQPASWVELQRETSPNGLVDAVLVQPDQQQSDLTLRALYLLPKGQLVPPEPPFKHLAMFLERVADKSVFAAFRVEDLSIEWTQDDHLTLSAPQALLYGQKSEHSVQIQGATMRIHLNYEIKDPRFSDSFHVPWEQLYGPQSKVDSKL